MNRSGVVALVLAREIDREKTLIKLKKHHLDNYSLAVQLYDTFGNYIPEDHGVEPYYFAPGILFSVSKNGNSVEIERIYLKPEYQKQHIGTSLMTYFETAARNAQVKVLCLEADTQTNAEKYWKTKHQFTVPDPTQPNYMEKRL